MNPSDPHSPRLTTPLSLDGAERLDIAADWLARRDAGFAPREQTQFDEWLAADPRHAATVAELMAAWSMVNRPRVTGRANQVLHELAARAQVRRRRRAIFAFASTGLATAAVLVFVFLPRRHLAPSATTPETITSTVTLRPQQQILADGSVVELNAGADILVDFSPARRAVRLVRGEAHFAVAKDTARPFVVSAGGVEVRAVGTEFAIRFAPQEIAVLVTEGQVAVARTVSSAVADAVPSVPNEPVLVAAGGRVVMQAENSLAAAPRRQQMTRAEVDAALAWRGNRVEFTGTPLADAVALFNRQNSVQLSLDDRTLDGLRVSGVFWIDDPDGFARLLESSFGVQAVRRGDTEIVLRKSP
ncbi:MAG: FecR family protein [Opitutaceae bacterium]